MKFKIENLSKSYPIEVQVLKYVSLGIDNGMYGLLCPNDNTVETSKL